jgi:hypothetical protein
MGEATRSSIWQGPTYFDERHSKIGLGNRGIEEPTLSDQPYEYVRPDG